MLIPLDGRAESLACLRDYAGRKRGVLSAGSRQLGKRQQLSRSSLEVAPGSLPPTLPLSPSPLLGAMSSAGLSPGPPAGLHRWPRTAGAEGQSPARGCVCQGDPRPHPRPPGTARPSGCQPLRRCQRQALTAACVWKVMNFCTD